MRHLTDTQPDMDSGDAEVFANHVGSALSAAITDFIDYDPDNVAAQDVEVVGMQFNRIDGTYHVRLTGGGHARAYRFVPLPIPSFSKDDPCLEVQYGGEY